MSVAENTGSQLLADMLIAAVKGRFRDFAGAIDACEVPSVAGTIRVASLEPLDARRVEHLRFVGNTVELALDITAVRAE